MFITVGMDFVLQKPLCLVLTISNACMWWPLGQRPSNLVKNMLLSILVISDSYREYSCKLKNPKYEEIFVFPNIIWIFSSMYLCIYLKIRKNQISLITEARFSVCFIILCVGYPVTHFYQEFKIDYIQV